MDDGGLNLEKLLKAMEDADASKDEAFEFTRELYILQQTCPDHGVGERSLELMRYVCPICKKTLAKSPKNSD